MASLKKPDFMKSNPTTKSDQPPSTSLHSLVLATIAFLLGIAATSLWFHYHRPVVETNGPAAAIPAQTESVGMPVAGVPASARPPVANSAPVTPAAIAAVKQAVPNFATVPLADGENILRTAAMKEFSATTKAMNAQLQTAQQQLLDAQNGQSTAAQQAAMKQVQETQAAAAAKLQQIAAQLSAQIAALESLKQGE